MVISPVLFSTWPFSLRQKQSDFLKNFFYFKKGSWALAYGIMALAKKINKKTIRVLFPDYFCKEPLEIIKQFPVDIKFYPIQKNYEPDWEKLEKICVQQKPDALVLVHYFGFANNLKMAKEFCDRWKIALIEDCAHVMPPYCSQGQSLGMIGDIAIWSPWKFFPLPDLGLLHMREDLQQFVEVMKPCWEVLPMLKWLVKRLAQRILCALGVNWHKRALDCPPPRTGSPSAWQCEAYPNTLSMYLFQLYMPDAEYIRKRRIENYKTLENLFKENNFGELVFQDLPDGVIPYVFPFLTKQPAQPVSREFIKLGIPVYTWPDLSEVIKNNKIDHYWANWHAEHLLLLPIHQNILAKQMEYLKKQIILVMG